MIKDIVAEIYPLDRTLVSEGLDRSLEVLGRRMPPGSSYRIEEFPAGKDYWTWTAPKRYSVREAYLEVVGGGRVVDFKDDPLHLVSYSVPVDAVLSWEELAGHLHYSAKRPAAVPWVFKYYDAAWGFCLSKDAYDRLPRDKKYRAVIRSEFADGPGLKVGVGLVHPEGGPNPEAGEILVSAHICHPRQANDNASAVGVGAAVAAGLAARPLPRGSASVRFLFQPETVGSVCYLASHEELIGRTRAAVILESIGNRNTLAVQRSWQGATHIDRVSAAVLDRKAPDHRSLPAWAMFSADEKVINGPGVGVPSVMFTRYPYEEYHTTDDDMDVIHEDMLQEAADVVEETVRIAASDYVPARLFKGPVHLSKHGLWADYRQDREASLAVQKAMLYFEGRHTVFDIAEALGMDYWAMRGIVESYRAKGLVEALPVPARPQDPAHFL
ncbi:MAG: DUF4910 domain-containing protein [Elusimicrobia bacterium]|nr:DUF4910 domain-containing protein [Elusimicrobiota bacterium]